MKLSHLAAGAAIAVALAAPAGAAPAGGPVRATGPTVVHAAPFTGVRSAVHAVPTGDGRTIVTLQLHGLPPSVRGTVLGAHVHTQACGAAPQDSGGHYANPHAPAGTPLHDREVWLDVAVGPAGNGHARAVVAWPIAAGDAGSVVVHAQPTDHATGAAGARLFCTTVGFGA